MSSQHSALKTCLFGALLFLPTVAIAQPVACPDRDVKTRASKLDKYQISSVQRLANETLALLKTPAVAANPECAGKVFYRYWQFYWNALQAYGKAYGQDLANAEPGSPLFKTLRRVGWFWSTSEAGDYVWADSDWLLQRFGPQLPPDWRAYLTQQAKQGRLTEDAILEVEWDVLRQRVVYWERFLKQYPAFPLNDDLKEDVADCLGLWLFGTDNTSVVEGRRLKKDLRASYERFLKENTDSSYTPLLTEYVRLLTLNKFAISDAARAFLKRNKVRNYQGVQPPAR